MAQSASDLISITVSQQVASLLLPGFGIPLILSAHTFFADRVRYYTANPAGLAQMVTDGFPVTDPAYLAASAISAQSPAPSLFGIGKLLNKPVQQFTVTPGAILNNTLYQFKFDGNTVAFTSGGANTLALTLAGLKTAFDAFAMPVTSVNTGAVLTLTANVAGTFHTIQSLDPTGQPTSTARANLGITQTQADPGTAADMAAIMASENASFAQAAWAGRVLPLVAGSENWAYKTLAGIPADQLSEAEINNACGIPTAGTTGKRGSVYITVYGTNVTEFGQVGSGSWLDITRGVDALIVDMGARIFTDLSGANKIPYSDKGITVIEKDVRASLTFFQSPPQNFLAEQPPFTVTVPKAANLTPAQRSARLLPNVLFQANLAGALNSVTVQGTVIP